jgi:hypothetical protein
VRNLLSTPQVHSQDLEHYSPKSSILISFHMATINLGLIHYETWRRICLLMESYSSQVQGPLDCLLSQHASAQFASACSSELGAQQRASRCLCVCIAAVAARSTQDFKVRGGIVVRKSSSAHWPAKYSFPTGSAEAERKNSRP